MYILLVYKKELLKNDYLKTLLITIIINNFKHVFNYNYYYYCYYYTITSSGRNSNNYSNNNNSSNNNNNDNTPMKLLIFKQAILLEKIKGQK